MILWSELVWNQTQLSLYWRLSIQEFLPYAEDGRINLNSLKLRKNISNHDIARNHFHFLVVYFLFLSKSNILKLPTSELTIVLWRKKRYLMDFLVLYWKWIGLRPLFKRKNELFCVSLNNQSEFATLKFFSKKSSTFLVDKKITHMHDLSYFLSENL